VEIPHLQMKVFGWTAPLRVRFECVVDFARTPAVGEIRGSTDQLVRQWLVPLRTLGYIPIVGPGEH
jgi:hypothetical protein